MNYNYHERIKGLESLASLDESEQYEVDTTDIAYDKLTDKFALITCSGCSCWDGEYCEEQFDTLDALEESLLWGAKERRHNPSLEGARTLIRDAKSSFANFMGAN